MTFKNEGDEYFAAFALFNGTDILEDRDELVPTDFNNNSQGQISYPAVKLNFSLPSKLYLKS